jgi:hypothetical protein
LPAACARPLINTAPANAILRYDIDFSFSECIGSIVTALVMAPDCREGGGVAATN